MAHLACHVHKSGRETAIVIIIIPEFVWDLFPWTVATQSYVPYVISVKAKQLFVICPMYDQCQGQTWGQFRNWNWNCLFKRNGIEIDKFGIEVCYKKNLLRVPTPSKQVLRSSWPHAR